MPSAPTVRPPMRAHKSITAPPTRRTFLGAIVAGLLAALVGWLPTPPPVPGQGLADDLRILHYLATRARPIEEEDADGCMDLASAALTDVERVYGGPHREARNLFLGVSLRCHLARTRAISADDLARAGVA